MHGFVILGHLSCIGDNVKKVAKGNKANSNRENTLAVNFVSLKCGSYIYN